MWHMHQFGLKTLARKNLATLLGSCRALAAKGGNARIATFADVCGLCDRPFSERRVNLVITLLGRLFASAAKKEGIAEQMGADDIDDAYVSWGGAHDKSERATKPSDASEVVGSLEELAPHNQAVLELLAEHVVLDARREKVILVDTLLTVVVDAFERAQLSNRQRMLALFKSYDTNGDGVLSIDEFSALLRACDGSIVAAKCDDIFLLVQARSEQLDEGVGDAILPAAFVLVAEECNLDTNPDD